MRFLFKKDVRPLLYVAMILLLLSCKKETIKVDVDAFAKLDTEIKSDYQVYTILFSLQSYNYKSVGVNLAKSRESLFKNNDVLKYTANEMSNLRYGVFINNLAVNTTYYYQIYVADSASQKVVYSDVLKFKTNP